MSKQDDITYVADVAQALEVTRPSVSNAQFLSSRDSLACYNVKTLWPQNHAAILEVKSFF